MLYDRITFKKYIYVGKITGNNNIHRFNKKSGERKYKNRLNTENVGLSLFFYYLEENFELKIVFSILIW